MFENTEDPVKKLEQLRTEVEDARSAHHKAVVRLELVESELIETLKPFVMNVIHEEFATKGSFGAPDLGRECTRRGLLNNLEIDDPIWEKLINSVGKEMRIASRSNRGHAIPGNPYEEHKLNGHADNL